MNKVTIVAIAAMVFTSGAMADKVRDSNSTKIIVYNPVSEYIQLSDPCLTTKVKPGQFGLSANRGGGVIDLNLQRYLKNAHKTGVFIGEMGADEDGIKMHIECLVESSAKMVAASLNLARNTKDKIFEENDLTNLAKTEFLHTGKIMNPEILNTYERAKKQLIEEQCRFNPATAGKETVRCGELEFEFDGNKVKIDGRMIVSATNRFGVSLSVPITVYDTEKNDQKKEK